MLTDTHSDTQPQIWAPGSWPGRQKCFSSNVTTIGKREKERALLSYLVKKKRKRKKKTLVKRKEIGSEKAQQVNPSEAGNRSSEEHLFIAMKADDMPCFIRILNKKFPSHCGVI